MEDDTSYEEEAVDCMMDDGGSDHNDDRDIEAVVEPGVEGHGHGQLHHRYVEEDHYHGTHTSGLPLPSTSTLGSTPLSLETAGLAAHHHEVIPVPFSAEHFLPQEGDNCQGKWCWLVQVRDHIQS